MKRILIIEDDRDIVELVRYNLANEGFQVSSALDGSTGLSTLKKTPPDLLLLDLMLPKLSGLEICREIRRDDSLNRLPILMLTAHGEEADRVVGLEMGADDYVTKPFSPRELLAHVKALLRRADRGPAPRRFLCRACLEAQLRAWRFRTARRHCADRACKSSSAFIALSGSSGGLRRPSRLGCENGGERRPCYRDRLRWPGSGGLAIRCANHGKPRWPPGDSRCIRKRRRPFHSPQRHGR